jgi:hypothetical protein
MRFYQQQHPFYCGVYLHAKTLHVGAPTRSVGRVDQAGNVLVHRNLTARRDHFLNALTPYRHQGIVAAAEPTQST